MKQIELIENNQILKARVMELETLLENYQNPMADPRLETTLKPQQQESVHRFSDVIKLQTQNTELSEKLLELQTQCEYATSREKSLIKLVNHLRENEPKLEMEIAEGIKQYQQQVEEKYVQDIQDLTETYEAEKRNLVLEIEQLAESYRKVSGGFDGSRREWEIHHETSVPVSIDLRDQSTQTFCETADLWTQTEPITSLDRERTLSPNQIHSPRSFASESEEEENSSHTSPSLPLHRTGSLRSASPTDLSARELRNLLDLESMRAQKAHDQIKELEKILEAQRSAFRKHIERERDVTIAALDVPTSDSEVDFQERNAPFFHESLGQLKKVLLSIAPSTPSNKLMSDIQQSLMLVGSLESGAAEKGRVQRSSLPPEDDSSAGKPDLQRHTPVDSLIPDWYLDVLRKLRQRVSDLETALPKKLSIDDRFNEKASNEEQLSEIKLRYEEALFNVQTALEEQTQLAKDQIERLEEMVREAKSQPPAPPPAPQLPPPSRQLTSQLEMEISHLQEALRESKEKFMTQEKAHSEELQEVWAHFQKYRAAQDLLTSSLESEIRSRDDSGKWFRGNNEEESFEYQELSALCEIKRASLRAVLDALVLLNAHLAVEGKEDHVHNDSESHPLREELLEARLHSAEREVSLPPPPTSHDLSFLLLLPQVMELQQKLEETQRTMKPMKGI
jgi:hypothetical protein